MWAAAEGHVDVVRRLIEAGADVHVRLRSGFTATFFAVREGHTDVVKILLDSGVGVNDVLFRPEEFDTENEEGVSALLLAVENGHFELAQSLLEAGADPNDERSGLTALHAITRVRKTGRGDGSDGDPPPDGSGSLTSLELVRSLVAHGADVNRRLKNGKRGRGRLTRKGVTPFPMAAWTADLPLLRTLLDLGADPLLPNVENSTPLVAAAGMGTRAPGEEPGSESECLEVLRLLLELGSDVNVVDDSGETAMHGAAYKNAPRIVEFLAECGARIDIWNRKNKHGWTPLIIAEGFRPGNFKPSPPTVAAFYRVMRAAGVTPPKPTPRSAKKPTEYEG
jgi:ankyrin repeat protein